MRSFVGASDAFEVFPAVRAAAVFAARFDSLADSIA
jgi:hypothetical protein